MWAEVAEGLKMLASSSSSRLSSIKSMSIISSGSLVAIAVSEGLAGPEAALSVLVVKAVEVQPSSSSVSCIRESIASKSAARECDGTCLVTRNCLSLGKNDFCFDGGAEDLIRKQVSEMLQQKNTQKK